MNFLLEFTDPAMENFGLITYNTSYLLPENVHMSKIVRLIAHELAHQWFGNLVTFIWWNYLWISEGFARLFEFILTDLVILYVYNSREKKNLNHKPKFNFFKTVFDLLIVDASRM